MSARATKTTQKELRQPDEFVTATARVVEWGRENQTTVQYAAVGLVVLLLAIAGVGWWTSSRDARANREFYSAIELYKAEQWGESFEGFRALAEDLGSTDYGRLATLYAGRAALKLDKPAEAIPFYLEYLDGSPPVALAQLAHLNLGRALSSTGDVEGARTQLQTALELEGPARPEATFELARVEQTAGNNERALELYGNYLEDNPNGPAVDLARAEVLALGGTPPPSPSMMMPGGINPLQFQVN